MQQGRAAEYDTPAALLQREGGIFRGLVDDTGVRNADFLRRVAQGEATIFESESQSRLHELTESAKHVEVTL